MAVTQGVKLKLNVLYLKSFQVQPNGFQQLGIGGWVVYVVVDGKAELRPVTLGQSAGSRLEVLSGLSDGEMVVVRGNERLRPGQPVNATLAGG